MTFELRTQEDDVLASLLSFVDRRDDSVPVVPMSVALVASVNSPPAAQVNGSIAVDERARADLTQLVAALQHNPDAPTTVSLPPELLERLSTSTSPRTSSSAGPGDGDDRAPGPVPAVRHDGPLEQRPLRALAGLHPPAGPGRGRLRDLFPGVTPDRSLFLAPAVIDDAGLRSCATWAR